jgi:hypothetical protein
LHTCAVAVKLTQSLSPIKSDLGTLPDECMDATAQTVFIKIAPSVARLRHRAHKSADDGTVVNEDDTESDEVQLQAELEQT